MGIFDWLFGKKEISSQHMKEINETNSINEEVIEPKKDTTKDRKELEKLNKKEKDYELGVISKKKIDNKVTEKINIINVVYNEICQDGKFTELTLVFEKENGKPVLKYLTEDDSNYNFEGDWESLEKKYIGMGRSVLLNTEFTYKISDDYKELIVIIDKTKFHIKPRRFNTFKVMFELNKNWDVFFEQ